MPLKSLGVAYEKFFLHFLYSLCIFGEYTKSILTYKENTPKVFNRTWRIPVRLKYLSIFGKHGDTCKEKKTYIKNTPRHLQRIRRPEPGRTFDQNKITSDVRSHFWREYD